MDAHEDRVERLLALLLLENLTGTKEEKAYKMNLAGFSNMEIAELLDISPQVVANYLSGARKKIRKTRRGNKK